MAPIRLQQVYSGAPSPLVDVLAGLTPLSKSCIKRALVFGGGWVKAAGKRQLQRCRKAKYVVKPGDTLAFYYDEALLAAPVAVPECLLDTPHFGVWYKPANQVVQGSLFGDANSLEAVIQTLRGHAVHVVNRLDREAKGLVLVAYEPAAAKALSHLWQQQAVEKDYQALVLGHPQPAEGHLRTPLEGKAAHTEYQVVAHLDNGLSHVAIRLHTGRYHQIRRHFADFGHPLMGDPAYGEGNRWPQGLQLAAVGLRFLNPCCQPAQPVAVRVPEGYGLF